MRCSSCQQQLSTDFRNVWDELSDLTLQWRHSEHEGISNYQSHNWLLNRLFRRRSKKTSKLHVTGLCEGNSPLTGEFPTQRASDAESVSIWWCHHEFKRLWIISPVLIFHTSCTFIMGQTLQGAKFLDIYTATSLLISNEIQIDFSACVTLKFYR